MCDKELLVGYLYGEVEPAERRAFESHLQTCADCRGDLKGLGRTRSRLEAWTPPKPSLEFQVVRGSAGAPAWRWLKSPVWGLAAAAVLVLAVASAVANVEVRYGADGLTVRTGWARASGTSGTAPERGLAAAAPRSDAVRVELEAISQRLRQLESSAAAGATLSTAHAPEASVPAPAVLRQVRQLVSESEARQQRELALRIMQVLRDVEGTRRVDLDRMQRGLAEVQGVADTTIIRQREMENHMLRVVQQR